MKIIPLASLIVLLIVMNYLFRKALERVSKRNIVVDYVRRYLPIMELVGWSAFSVWLLNILFSNSRYNLYINTLIFLTVFIFISWYFIRDFIAGVQVKSRYNFKIGQRIESRKLHGKITKLGLLAINIKSDNGSEFIIPYSGLDQKSIALNFHQESNLESKFTIEFKRNLDEEKTIKKINELIVNSAWCSHKTLPDIQVIDETDTKKIYEVTCQPNGKDGAVKLKELLQKNI